MEKITNMKNISIYIIVDNLFRFILLFLVNLIWCTYFISPSYVSVLLAFGMSILMIYILNKIHGKNNVKKLIQLKEEQRIEDITNTFLFMTKSEIVSFFYRLASSRHKCTIKFNHIEIETESLPVYLYPMFKPNELDSLAVLEIYKKIKDKKIKRIIILTNTIAQNISNITKYFNFEVIILNKKECYYKLLKEYEFYPEIKIKNNKIIKNNFKQILQFALNKRKTKSYLFSAIFLIFSSIFVRNKLYYLIFSSILILLALFSHLNPTFNKIEKNNLLE